ncbi:hypothetical protein CCHR01_01099 [Colletotrichum chrysophilum]|uniref:Uncharacterized protein n=1 Tax=Colletotrichum chrysophilum TaxID=1836956 RepID=A0AAD9EPT7_9PEZI|nr:hypothetical protein CCHR01_01099 [Colletotrichum chrysophilum]
MLLFFARKVHHEVSVAGIQDPNCIVIGRGRAAFLLNRESGKDESIKHLSHRHFPEDI